MKIAAVTILLTLSLAPVASSQMVTIENSNICVGLLCPDPIQLTGSIENNAMTDVYSFTGTSGTAFVIQVDTVAYATAFDPWVIVCQDASASGGLSNCFSLADDDFQCAQPPPSFSCPRAAGTLPPDADGIYWIGVASHPCCGGSFRTPGLGEYQLEIDLESYPTIMRVDLAHDNRNGNL